MLFVDGENFTIRGQALAQQRGLRLVPGKYWRADIYLWFPDQQGRPFLGLYPERPTTEPVRAHYYTSAVGDDSALAEVRQSLWRLGFAPTVIKKQKSNARSKGVDISIATDMLSGAYKHTYDTAVLVAGDGDYVPLLDEVRRQGRRVVVMFYGEANGLSPALRLAADAYVNLENWTVRRWRHHLDLVQRGEVADGPVVAASVDSERGDGATNGSLPAEGSPSTTGPDEPAVGQALPPD